MKKSLISLFIILTILCSISSGFTAPDLDYVPQSIYEIFTAEDLTDPGSGCICQAIDNGDLVFRAAGGDLNVLFDDYTYRQHCIEASGDLCAISVEWSTKGTPCPTIVQVNDFELGNFIP